jgi:hypothetical protein
MKENTLIKIINTVRILREDGMLPTNNTSNGNIAGLPPDQPPVDLRKKNYSKLPFFYKNIFRRKKNV